MSRVAGLTDFVGIEADTARLLLFANQADRVQSGHVPLRKSLLHRHPNLTVHTNLADMHFYIFAKARM